MLSQSCPLPLFGSQNADREALHTEQVEWMSHGADAWCPFPDWANFFLGLGCTVASPEDASRRSVVAVTTPTRSFATPLCAAGVVIGYTKARVSTDSAEHLAHLRTLALGTAVTYRGGLTGSRRGRGTLHGFESVDGEEYVLIRVARGDLHKMPARMAHRIDPMITAPRRSSGRTRFTRVNLDAGLMAQLVSADQAASFAGSSRMECVMIGNKRLLYDEIKETPFAVSMDGLRKVEGHLQDVLRAKAFLPEGACYRSDVISLAARRLPSRLLSSPAVAIFDGSRSFLRWSGSYPGAHWIIILDRTDKRFIEATELIDALHANRIAGPASLTIQSSPVGIECVAFDARRDMA